MTKLERQKQGNSAWETVIADQGGGSGTVSEITSVDMSITVTNPAGPTVDLSANGGSQPIEAVGLDFAFDTEGLVVPADVITVVNQGAKKFTVAGDRVARYSVASVGVFGSSANDGVYTVVSATLVTGNTEVVVSEALTDESQDGTLCVPGPIGVHVCDLAEGDMIPINQYNTLIATLWDGSSPRVALFSTSGRGDLPGTLPDTSIPNGTQDLSDASFLEADLYYPKDSLLTNGPYIAAVDTAIWACIHNGSFADPGSTQGAAQFRFNVFRGFFA